VERDVGETLKEREDCLSWEDLSWKQIGGTKRLRLLDKGTYVYRAAGGNEKERGRGRRGLQEGQQGNLRGVWNDKGKTGN